jgi:hypothetical protein
MAYINTDPFLVFFGGFYIVLGLSMFLAKAKWQEFISLLEQYDALSLVLGILVLPISLFIIVFYNNFDGLAPTILTITGYIGFAKAVLLLLWPKIFQKFIRLGFVRKWLWLDGVSGIILGVAILVL